MKKHAIVLLILFSMLMTTAVSAEMYTYIDENGHKRWTDDLNQVPASQRDAVVILESAQPIPEKASEGPQDSAPPVDSATPSIESDSTTTAAAADVNREALEKEKAILDALYQELLAERKVLEKMSTEKLDSTARNDLTKRITAFNNKTEQYETQLNQFNQKINAFNQKIISNQPVPESKQP